MEKEPLLEAKLLSENRNNFTDEFNDHFYYFFNLETLNKWHEMEQLLNEFCVTNGINSKYQSSLMGRYEDAYYVIQHQLFENQFRVEEYYRCMKQYIEFVKNKKIELGQQSKAK